MIDYSQFQSIEELKKKQPQANGTNTKQDGDKDKAQPSQAKSTEPKQGDAKKNKEQSQKQSSEPKQNDNKTKKAAPAATASKPYFTSGAQGDSEHSYRILDTLIGLFDEAIRKAFPEVPNLPVVVVPGKQSDYQCNSAMQIVPVSKNVLNITINS